MFRFVILSLACLASAGDHPAVKIIALLQKLQAQVKEEGQTEENAYAKFTYWCKETIKKSEKDLAEAKEAIAVAESTIEAMTADIETLTADITDLESKKTAADTAKTAAQTQRDNANGKYNQNKADLEGTISAVGTAVSSLVSSDKSFVQTGMKQAEELLKKYAPAKSGFLQASPRTREYDFKSGNIIEMLKEMKLSFEDDLNELNTAETEAANAHKLADAAKQDEIEAMSRAITAKTDIKSAKGEELSGAESDKADGEADRDAAATLLSDTQTTCKTRADEWAERSERRAGEIKAMGEAVEVLEKVTGVRTPESKGVSFLQLTRFPKGDVRKKIVNLLRKAGNTKLTSKLAKLADKIASLRQTPGSGVFDQIKNMIEKMIFHLKSEQTDEDEHYHWCEKELDQTTKMTDDKEDRNETMTADINDYKAEIQELSNKIQANMDFISATDAEIQSRTEQRSDEKDENAATVKDAQDAQTAISQAIAVLEDFYKSTGEVASEAWEFRQVMVRHHRVRQEPEPQLWTGGEDGRYQGTTGGSAVIGLLADTAADFAEMQSKAEADETTQQGEYDTWLTAAQIDKAKKQQDAEMMSGRKDRFSEKLASREADHAHTVKELEATNQYMSDLQRACVDGDSSYADRKAARTKEITALKNAEKILDEAFNEA
jgi:chromosome segregation ATPase